MILSIDEAVKKRHIYKLLGETLVMTNGVFDIIHPGHCDYLQKAAMFGRHLWVAINSDKSVQKIKGDKRPLISCEDRIAVLLSLRFVDATIIFNEETPIQIYRKLLPDVLVKGADYSMESIVGAKEVIANGGRVETVELTPNRSTTNIVEIILERYQSK